MNDKSNHSGAHQHETDTVFQYIREIRMNVLEKIKCVELNI